MRPTLSLIRREISAYFFSPIAYVVLVLFLSVTGYLFYLSLNLLTATGPKGLSYPMGLMVNDIAFWLVFLFIPPLLTMRLFAEERSTGTLEMLLTAPLRDWQIVFGKFVAAFVFYVFMWLPTLLYLPALLNMSFPRMCVEADPWPVVTTYIGILLVGAMFLSLGMFVSSLVRSQLVAALIALFLGLNFIVLGIWRPDGLSTRASEIFYYFTVPLHFERNFSRGVIDTRQLVLYASLVVLFLFLTVRSLESRRWR